MITHNYKIDAPIIASYKNGNYNVELYEDGTKIRFADVDKFEPEFPENIDVCITKCCDGGCPYCYEGCTPEGKHGTLLELNDFNGNLELPKWIQSLKPGTELALNGNDLTCPHIELFLWKLHEHGIITNITINQRHLHGNAVKLKMWQKHGIIHGIGISLSNPKDEYLWEIIKHLNNVVVHVIAGILTVDDIIHLQTYAPKVLILGYKNIGRARRYSLNHADDIMDNIATLKANLKDIMFFKWFSGVAFDNLAIEQLDVKKTLFNDNEEKWSKFYMGDDGSFTMYIDMVAGTYAKNSCMSQEERYPIGDKTVQEMFEDIKRKYNTTE